MEPKPKPLFDKPMDELREAFVRARFSQEFGRPDIETWLAREREAERPDGDSRGDESPWNAVCCMDSMFSAFSKRPFVNAATPFASPPSDAEHPFDQLSVRAPIAALSAALGRGARVFYGHVHGLVVAVPDAHGTHVLYTLDAGPRGGYVVKPIETGTVTWSIAAMDVLFAEWLYGRPRCREARQLLCDALAADIANERRKAEHDFDTAVAVSADGTKIVHADWVVVLEHGRYNRVQSLRVFEGSDFHARKIRYSENRRRTELTGTYKGSERAKVMNWSLRRQIGELVLDSPCRRTAEQSPYEQQYALTRSLYAETVGRLPQASILITPASECPSPLPDGGVEIDVWT